MGDGNIGSPSYFVFVFYALPLLGNSNPIFSLFQNTKQIDELYHYRNLPVGFLLHLAKLKNISFSNVPSVTSEARLHNVCHCSTCQSTKQIKTCLVAACCYWFQSVRGCIKCMWVVAELKWILVGLDHRTWHIRCKYKFEIECRSLVIGNQPQKIGWENLKEKVVQVRLSFFLFDLLALHGSGRGCHTFIL